MKTDMEKYRVKPGSKTHLEDHDPGDTGGLDKNKGKEKMAGDIEELVMLQEKLYAGNRHSVLIILQAMDAAGKDGVIKHVMSGLNPQGCRVTSFKHPTDEDYDHDFFRRYQEELPAHGEIGIFNRSHYENVLICRVHPEYVLQEKLPGYDSIDKLDKKFWSQRLEQICSFEKNLAQNGMLILKFFLNVSKAEQRKRLLKRIDDPGKHWKFDFADIGERDHWDEYMKCYEEAISATSAKHAPWYIIPADHKWYARTAIAHIIARHLKKLDPKYPALPKEGLQKLEEARKRLAAEK